MTDQSPPDQRPWYAKKRFILPIAFVAFFFVLGVVSGDGEDDDKPASPQLGTLGGVEATTVVPSTTTTTTTAAPSTTTITPPSIRGEGEVTESRFEAFDVCKKFVGNRLKAPSGAKWRDPFGDQVSYIGDGSGPITVAASVDSENGFGAKIRSGYTCTVSLLSGDTWHLDNLEVRDGAGE